MLSGKSVLQFDVATATTKGARDYQEDSLISSFSVGQDTGFAVLADGMGGHHSGSVASSLVVAEALSQLKPKEALFDNDDFDIPRMLTDMAASANARIAQHVQSEKQCAGMGTTLLTTVISNDALYWVSVGDSPLFLFRDGGFGQINQDHSMAPQIDMMVQAGAMTADVGRNHPDRNTLTSAISGNDIHVIDCPENPVPLLHGDIVIMASDGLQFLSDTKIAQILKITQGARAVDIATALLSAIKLLDDPEQDNAAFAVIKLYRKRTKPAPPQKVKSLPVLAMGPDETADIASLSANYDSPKKRVIKIVTTDHPKKPQGMAIAPDPEQAPDARKTYSYRGNKYYKD